MLQPFLWALRRLRNEEIQMKKPCWLVCALIVFLLFLSGATAQTPKETPPLAPEQTANTEPKAAEPPHELTPTDLAAFLDGFMPIQLEREDIAGAVVLVVKDGKVIFAKGYGYKDVAQKTPVTVDGTLFRPGSISKLFTWTAVMQLVEQGKLDLDRDVNDYLDFKIPATFPQPITLRHIMTHTAGFEETIKEMFVPEGSPMPPLKDYLPRHIPRRIFPPGTTPAYSNYATTIAGYIVERVSGKPFTQYVADNIFRPLGMTHSTFVQPLPPELKPLMSNGYKVGSKETYGFEMISAVPAGGLSITATDISHFMIAHLQGGKFEGAQILRPETARLMHTRQSGWNPAMNAMCLGFYEESRNGHRIFGHGGDTIYFHSDLHLMPDAGLGFFISYNSRGQGGISPRIVWRFLLDRYFPYTPPKFPKQASAEADAQTVAGHYMTSRRFDSTTLKLDAMLNELIVRPDKDGNIKVNSLSGINGQVKIWEENGPLVYRAVNSQEKLAFKRDDSGNMTMYYDFPAVVGQRVSLLQDRRWNQVVLIGSLTVLGLTFIAWPVLALVRRHYGHRLELSPQQRRLRWRVRIVCALHIIFLLGYLTTLLQADDLALFSGKLDLRFYVLQVLGLIAAGGTLLVLYAGFRSFRETNIGFWTKAWNLVIVLACIGSTWYAMYWNMLNFNMNY